MMLESEFHCFTSGWPVFPAQLIKEIVFSPLYIFVSFVKDKVPIGAWICLQAFYVVPLVYISVFVPVPYCLDYCSFVVYSVMSKRLIAPALFFFLKIVLAIWDLSCFHTNHKNFLFCFWKS